ncbi:MAG: hypothetical protein LBH20_00290, partial [Treponema sp.]|nr:hypothetical protein [Treponema sp.]
MGNFKNRSIHKPLLVILAVCAVFASGCPSPFDSHPLQKKRLPPGCGSFTLNLDNSAARTILPNTPYLADFAVFNLNFAPVAGVGVALNVDKNINNVANPITLREGTYTLSVKAYKDSAKTILMAQGTLTDIIISAGINTNAKVTLHALFDEGTGVFNWEIGIDTSFITVDSATMTIMKGGITENPVENLTTTGAKNNGNRTLASGLYSVVFNLAGTDSANRPMTLVWYELLHIYSGLDSNFEMSFDDAHFTNTHWNVTFNFDDDSGGSAQQSVMHGNFVSASNPG